MPPEVHFVCCASQLGVCCASQLGVCCASQLGRTSTGGTSVRARAPGRRQKKSLRDFFWRRETFRRPVVRLYGPGPHVDRWYVSTTRAPGRRQKNRFATFFGVKKPFVNRRCVCMCLGRSSTGDSSDGPGRLTSGRGGEWVGKYKHFPLPLNCPFIKGPFYGP